MKTTVQPVLARHEIAIHSKEYERQNEERKLEVLKMKLLTRMQPQKQSLLFVQVS
jgi:hypothetical protein